MIDRPTTRDELEHRIRNSSIEGSPEEMRAAFRSLFAPCPEIRTHPLGGVPCARFGEGPPLLWLHGGGLVLGGPDTHARAAGYVARTTGHQIVLPDYPLAPKAPWPAQRDACQAVLDALDGPVPVVGDSVGGQLALILALRRPNAVASLALISPNSDRSGQSTTRDRDTDLMNDGAGDTAFARSAMGDLDPTDPEVSPLLADLSGLPPTLILAAGAEMLLDDSLLLARALALRDVAVTLRVWPGLFHLWPLWPDILPEARDALDAVAVHVTMGSPSSRAPV